MIMKWSTVRKWNGVQDDNEMEYRMIMKWCTRWKWNGVQDDNEVEYRMKIKYIRCCNEIQEDVYFLDWLVIIFFHLFINCFNYATI